MSVTLTQCYTEMARLRALDNLAVVLQRTGQIGTYPSLKGSEALHIGVGHALAPHHVFVPYYRDQGIQWLRGMPWSGILAYWKGLASYECHIPHHAPAYHDFPVSIPIASHTLHACGIAKAMQHRQQKSAVLVSIGDGATSKGDFYEAINVAGVWSLPVVFLVNNNGWAISTPLAQQTCVKPLTQKAAGMMSVSVDGTDVFAVYDVVNDALKRTEIQQKPCFIEAQTVRLADHTTADDAKRYQSDALRTQTEARDPLPATYQYLIQTEQWTSLHQHTLQQHIDHDVAIARQQLTTYYIQSD
jgi:2-oxoisovalerate dehydrogenase E1 component alpha subunit